MTISGVNFGEDPSKIEVFIASRECNTVTFVSLHQKFTCNVQAGVGSGLEVVVYVDNQNTTSAFAYLGIHSRYWLLYTNPI